MVEFGPSYPSIGPEANVAAVIRDELRVAEASDALALVRGAEIAVDTQAERVKVTETAPGLKGATVNNTLKPATVETGLVVQVPEFIDVDEVIRVETETGDYVSRAK